MLWLLTGCALHEKIFAKEAVIPPAETSAPSGSADIPTTPPKPEPLVHTVRWQGESLWIIAKWYTGDGRNWETIAEANPGLDPRRIDIDDTIQVPDYLLKTRDPLPKSYVASQSQSRPSDSTESEEPAEDNEDLELFGPK